MQVVAFFTKIGIPELGLTPTIKIVALSDNTEVINTTMTESANGFYVYNFSEYVQGTEYTVLCDGGPSLADLDRYTYGVISDDHVQDGDITTIADAVWDELGLDHRTDGTTGGMLAEIFNRGFYSGYGR